MKAVMYHYVRPFDPEMPYFKNLDIEDFEKQLDFFEAEFGFVSKADFSGFICYGNIAKRRGTDFRRRLDLSL
ncbi:hypothetical protein [Flavobacterium sp. 3HN19-14]|uniref:hypothetical protein n=1 Tax=Flavobacterium sp. 3HN19-14 TaxID=3448133 RepID=UPI003EDED132